MNPGPAEHLLMLQQKDKETRERLLREGRLYGLYADEMQSVHRANAQALNTIIEQHGWPGVSLVGEEAARAEDGKPPEDSGDYRRRADDWARQVGWHD